MPHASYDSLVVDEAKLNALKEISKAQCTLTDFQEDVYDDVSYFHI